jgi:hypothetical protein
MKLTKDIRSDLRTANKMRLPWWGVLCLLFVCMPLPWLFDHFGKLSLMLPIWNCFAVLGLIVVLKWNLKRHLWFWITITIIAALHVALILFIPWTTKWVPALAIAAVDSMDFILILATLLVVGKLVGSPDEI